MTDEPMRTDVLIVGGGLVGLTLGCALAGAGVTCAVVERDDPARWADTAFDGRTIAVAQGSKRVLETLGIWRRLADDACPITDIRVCDRGAPLFLHFDSSELDEGPLGYIVENRLMRMALLAHGQSLEALTLMAPASLSALDRDGSEVDATVSADGTPQQVRAAVVLACDGRGSRLRTEAGIDSWHWRYDQHSMVCTIGHTVAHGNVAHELFLDGGPLAILPMTDAPGAPDGPHAHRSSIVWTDRASVVPGLMAATPDQFQAELVARIGGVLGEIEVIGDRFCHPLGLNHARHYTARRLALVGDAAHGIHPIAGQGWNMGLRDAAVLAQILVDGRRLGLDLGSDTLLGDYEARRRFDNSTLASMTDGLNRFFGVGHRAVTAARQVGLAAVNRSGRARRVLMRHAMGLPGDMPGRVMSGGPEDSRLARGQPL